MGQIITLGIVYIVSGTSFNFSFIAPFVVILLASGWAGWIFSTRRVHDQDISAGYLLLALIPFVGGTIFSIISIILALS